METYLKSRTGFGMALPKAGAGSLLLQGRRLLAGLRGACQVPTAGQKPRGLHVSDRAWRRNSALLMSLYEQRGHGE